MNSIPPPTPKADASPTSRHPPFRDQVRRPEAGRLWMYEAVPPREDFAPEKILKRIRKIREALGDLSGKLCAFFVPDIDPQEVGFGERQSADATWLDARSYAELIRKKVKGAETVICRSSVAHPEEKHAHWLRECWEKRFHAVVAVGGDTRQKKFPGPSPERFAKLAGELRTAKEMDIAVGGICLPQRGMVNRYGEAGFRPDPDLEPRRMLEKNALGVEFFMMQIMYDPEDALRVVSRYGTICRAQGKRPGRVFCGLAPVTDPRDWKFLQYLGVNVPDAARAEIGEDPETMGARSIAYIVRMMAKVFASVDPSLAVPLDVCIECTAPRNVTAAADLLGKLMEGGG